MGMSLRGEVSRMLTKLYVKASTMLRNDEGATAVEYGLMVALIAVAIIVTVGLLGQGLNTMFQGVLAAI